MIEIIDCQQNTDQWHYARLAIPTASKFGIILSNGRDGGESLTRKEYLYRLAGEAITGELTESYSNKNMQRGHDQEPILRDYYAFMTDTEPKLIGFAKNGRKGASPDALVNDDGVVEFKSCFPHILIPMLLKDEFPPKFKAQTQGQLLVLERDYVDIVVGYASRPGNPSPGSVAAHPASVRPLEIKIRPLIKRAYRDSMYIRQLSVAINQFNDELDELIEKVRAYGGR